MAERLKIEGNFMTIFENGTPSIEYINEQRPKITPRYTDSDEVEFFVNSQKIGNYNKVKFDCTTIIDDRTGSPFTTVDELKSFLREKLGFFLLSGNGFIDYNDTTGQVSIAADTWLDVPNNGLGVFSNSDYRPYGVSELLDVSTGYIDTTELKLGDTILIRNDYSVKPNTNNALLKFRYVLGTGAGQYTLEKIVGRLDSGSGQFYRFSLQPDLIYMGDTNTKDNPIKLQINLSTKGTLLNAGSVIQTILS